MPLDCGGSQKELMSKHPNSTQKGPSLALNQRPSRCKVTVQTAALPNYELRDTAGIETHPGLTPTNPVHSI